MNMAIMSEEQLIEWARVRAGQLRHMAKSDPELSSRPGSAVRPRVARELDFLRVHAANTVFYLAAEELFKAPVHPGRALLTVAEVLDGWAQYVSEGLAETAPFEVRLRAEAATDLMEQVQTLLDDPKVHPAAPVMLAGAALEEFLRGMLVGTSESVSKPSISKYAEALKRADAIDAQDVKDITAWAGDRNAAAHGEFDKLSVERARIMVSGVNLFMRQNRLRPSAESASE